MRFFTRSKPAAECRDGAHRYTSSQKIGPGIQRRICGTCSSVSIDLTADDGDIVEGLFADRAESVPAET